MRFSIVILALVLVAACLAAPDREYGEHDDYHENHHRNQDRNEDDNQDDDNKDHYRRRHHRYRDDDDDQHKRHRDDDDDQDERHHDEDQNEDNYGHRDKGKYDHQDEHRDNYHKKDDKYDHKEDQHHDDDYGKKDEKKPTEENYGDHDEKRYEHQQSYRNQGQSDDNSQGGAISVGGMAASGRSYVGEDDDKTYKKEEHGYDRHESYRDHDNHHNHDRDRDHEDRDNDNYDNDECRHAWVENDLGNKCYFYYTTFNTFSHFETQAFCNQLGGRVVEPKSQAEYNDALSFVRRYNGWTEGPLLNYFAPANDDTTIVLGSNFQAPSDYELLQTLQNVAKQTTNGAPLVNQCFTFTPDLQSKFGPCNGSNNPFCEKKKRNRRDRD